MITHPGPESVFIAGGGEGATLRQVLAYPSVKRAIMVDIDKEVVELCREFLFAFHQGSFADPRVELSHVDARSYLEECGQRFDVIIIDIPEPLEGGPAYLLYTQEFYQLVKRSLAVEGIVSIQAGSADWNSLQSFAAVTHTLRTAFPIVCPYQVHIPSFGGCWGFVIASQDLNPLQLSPQEIEERISHRLSGSLQFYDGLSHQNIFSLPKHLRQLMAEKNNIITDRNPLFI